MVAIRCKCGKTLAEAGSWRWRNGVAYCVSRSSDGHVVLGRISEPGKRAGRRALCRRCAEAAVAVKRGTPLPAALVMSCPSCPFTTTVVYDAAAHSHAFGSEHRMEVIRGE